MRVGVVGCGTGGPAAAVLLARLGHDVEVLEQEPDPGPAGAGLLLQPTGMAVLERLGVLDQVRAGADPVRRVHGETAAGRTIMDLRYADLRPDLHALGVHRGVLFGALHEALAAAGVPVRAGVRVVARRGGVLTDAGAASTARTTSSWPPTAPARPCAPPSRAGSASASTAGARCGRSCPTPTGAAAACSTRCSTARSGCSGCCRPASRRTWAPAPCRCSGRCAADRQAAVRAAGLEALKAEMLALAPRAEPVLAGLDSFDALVPAGYRDVRLRRWHADGLAVVGDAGHAMSPQLGQGANLALMDAAALADALARERELAAALAAYSRARRLNVRYYTLASWALNAVFQHDRAAMAWPRDHLIGPAARHAAAAPADARHADREAARLERRVGRPAHQLDQLPRRVAHERARGAPGLLGRLGREAGALQRRDGAVEVLDDHGDVAALRQRRAARSGSGGCACPPARPT